ncbi:MAG: Septum formation inhibitor MinC [Lacrimispora sp.]|nr:Septum formation inhibitor MinC [Lacrimispora sp.]
MHDTVVIKSNKAGMTVILDPDHAKFWGSAQMTLTIEGREVTPVEEFAIINQITKNSNVEIICLVDTDANRLKRCEKALNEKLMELSCQTGQFFKGNLQNGETLESEASIVIIGDVLNGAKVMAKGNVIVLGKLSGTVCAGVAGNKDALITALDMAPTQLRIADCTSGLDGRSRRLGRGPMKAYLENNKVLIKPMKKSVEIFRKLR